MLKRRWTHGNICGPGEPGFRGDPLVKDDPSLSAYLLLRARVDRFAESIRARYPEQIACRPGCASCCPAGLSLVIAEAVTLGQALDIEPDRIHLQAGQPSHREDGPCDLLDAHGRCAVYADRPLICRTHGLPLKYQERGDYVVCEKNFVSQAPHASSVLDMENVEKMLFAANLDYCRRLGINPLVRVAMDRVCALAAQKPVVKDE